jgi:hypothetical protein
MKNTIIGVAIALVSIVAAMHLYLLDGIEGELYSIAFKEDTLYASGYTDNAFRRITPGVRESEVREILNTPLGEAWTYNCGPMPLSGIVGLSARFVVHVHRFSKETLCLKDISAGMTEIDLLRKMGQPIKKLLIYSRSRHDQSYRVRTVTLERGVVVDRKSYFYVD